MKKLFLSLVALFAMATAAQAEGNGIGKAKLFKNVGFSVEAGVHGAGVNLSTTLVHKHLYLMLGYNFPELEYNTDFDVSTGNLNQHISEINGKIDLYNSMSGQHIDNLTQLGKDEQVDVTAKVKMFTNFKAMLQYFPSANSGFHFTAGVMIGEDELIHGEGQFSVQATKLYNQYLDVLEKPEYATFRQYAGLNPADKVTPTVTLNDQTFEVDRSGKVELGLQVEKIKPYVGIGFGNAIPQDHRVGFQFELGTWFHGTPKLVGGRMATADEMKDAEITTDDFDFSKLTFIPTMTFRITGRIF